MADDLNLLNYLPEVFSGTDIEVVGQKAAFLPSFLRIFEIILEDLEWEVETIPNLFDPWKTDRKFLPWLASWVALNLPEEFVEKEKRSLINQIVAIFSMSGLPEGLRSYLKIFIGSSVEISEEEFETPHLFKVSARFTDFNLPELERFTRKLRKILDAEKPAHTNYIWEPQTVSFQIGVHSTVGVDTFIGVAPKE
jgi:phage tail-like protein